LWRRSDSKEDAITRSRTITGLVAASAIAFGGYQALAASANGPDWPCVQRRVATVTSAQMWDGPDVDDLTQWRDNDEMKKLIARLISRRLPLEQATDAIAQFAAAQQPDARDQALKLLFAGLVDTTNNDRSVVIHGIERFQQRQKARAVEIEKQAAELRQLKEQAATDERARAELAAADERHQWDVRVFTERQQSIPLACEVPVLIEQRLFELGRAIRTHMSE
jgi:phage/plasmid primase-like uncharacterized protein